MDKLEAYIRKEEANRAIGIIEFYMSTLGESGSEKNARRILEICIKTLEKNML